MNTLHMGNSKQPVDYPVKGKRPIVEYKGRRLAVKAVIKNVVIIRVNKTVSVGVVKKRKLLARYNRYHPNDRTYTLSPIYGLEVGDRVTIGYAGRKLSPSISHVMITRHG